MGESEGKYEEATATNFIEDLEDVITWASSQSWYREPFFLSGHSLGGLAIGLYAEKFPEKVKGLAPISTVVTGKLTVEAEEKYQPLELETWRSTGWRESKSQSKPGVVKRLPWSHIEDRLKYNLLDRVGNLKMPVLLLVGEKDILTPPEHQKILLEKLPGRKELHIIKDAPHTFRDPKHLEEIKNLLESWIESLG